MEKVRLRHHQAEELIEKAKTQEAIRQDQIQKLKARGRTLPPETSLLGAWQVIEKTILYNVSPSRYPNFKIGDYITIFRAITPDKYIVGESISSGETIDLATTRPTMYGNVFECPTMSFAVTGRVMREGFVKYRELPEGFRSFGGAANGQPFHVTQLPRLLEAQWDGWSMEGKNFSDLGTIEFKAVRIGRQNQS